ncbi:hypothetical protein Pint_22411 [Pistacia integerrima]|uniref:Uncharacterized protein n=1 Tax=Pistacia integerrima TaxID=434235 RepID=A0ACC0YH67_9ROSI|nr:hypothetical protein Pint_22411 [Pistacia integerrima]
MADWGSNQKLSASPRLFWFVGWCSTAVKFTEFNAASVFPPLDFRIPQSMHLPPDDSVVLKRFVFESSKIAELKAKASGPMVLQPTPVEALTALIWKYLISVSILTKGFPRL